MADNITLWTGAGISFAGIVVGAGIAELRDWLKDGKTRRRVENALSIEILAQANAIATCASLVNFVESGTHGVELNTSTHLSTMPPEPIVYRSLASQLPLLDTTTVSAVLAFYGSVEWAKRVSTQNAANQTVPTGFVPILGVLWRAAARNAIIACQKTGSRLKIQHDGDAEQLEILITQLADVVERRSPRVGLNAATGNIEIQ